MSEHRIERIIWHREYHRIDVTYVGGESALVVATEAVAKELAEDADLIEVSAASGLVRWEQKPKQRLVAV